MNDASRGTSANVYGFCCKARHEATAMNGSDANAAFTPSAALSMRVACVSFVAYLG